MPCPARPARPAGVASGSRPRSATLLTGLGFDEAVTFSLVAERARHAPIDPAGPAARSGSSIPAASARTPCGRAWSPACWPSGAHNEAHGNPDAELFEIANVYLPAPGEPLPRRADPAGAGLRPRLPRAQGGGRGAAGAAARRRHRWRPGPSRSRCSPPAAPPSCRWATTHLGYLGEVDRRPARRPRAPRRLLGGRAGVRRPARGRPTWSRSHRPLPPFPAVVRDLSLVVDRTRLPGPTWPPPSAQAGAALISRRSTTSTPSRAATSPTASRASTSACASATPSGPSPARRSTARLPTSSRPPAAIQATLAHLISPNSALPGETMPISRFQRLICLVIGTLWILPSHTQGQEPQPPSSTRRSTKQPPPAARSRASAPTTELKPAAPETPTDPKTEQSFSLFGDTRRFGRLGGWGGVGGAMGQFGLGPSMLIMTPAVQKELELSDEQKQALRDWSVEMRDKGREMARSMRDESETNMRQMNITGAMSMMGRLNIVLQQNEQGVRRILTKAQWTRLQQIGLQMQGVTALTREDIAQALVLAPEQYGQIQTLMAQTQLRQVGYWMQQGMAMRQRAEAARNRPADAPKPTEANPKPPTIQPDPPATTDDKTNDDPESAETRRRRREDMRRNSRPCAKVPTASSKKPSTRSSASSPNANARSSSDCSAPPSTPTP